MNTLVSATGAATQAASHAAVQVAARVAAQVAIVVTPGPSSGGGIPDPGTGSAPADIVGRVTTILQLIAWLMTAGAVGGVLLVAGGMFVAWRRNEFGEHFARLGLVGVGCALIGTASTTVAFFIG